MVYAVARLAGWLPEHVRCEHVSFGHVLGPDRKMFKTRSGETVKLMGLVNEAIERADEALVTRASGLDEASRVSLATQIARAAIKYADLSTERQRDYVFDLDRMLAFEGDTGPYLQYAHARLRSIFRRLGHRGARAGRPSRWGPRPSATSRSACSGCPRRSSWP
jgi:arginyl-tRNA synthetase